MIRSTYEQHRRMQKRWTAFKVLDRTTNTIQWEGELKPRSQPYRVEVLHRLNRQKPRGRHPMPEVRVTAPLLRRRSAEPNNPIPHVYMNPHTPYLPLLCLYDPTGDEWHPGRFIADTIVPWTAEWLWRYEFWLQTGIWPVPG